MPSDLFFSFAERLVSYNGALAMRIKLDHQKWEQQEKARPIERPAAHPDPNPHQQAMQERTDSREVFRGAVEISDDGQRIVGGVAVDADGTPSWVRKRARSLGVSEIDVVPGDPAALAFSPSFRGMFTVAQVKASGDNERSGSVVVQDR